MKSVSQHEMMLHDLWEMYKEAYESARLQCYDKTMPARIEQLSFYAGVLSGLSIARGVVAIMGPQALEIIEQRMKTNEVILKGLDDDIQRTTRDVQEQPAHGDGPE